MTFSELVKSSLSSILIPAGDVDEIFNAVVADIPPMNGRWEDDTSAYPPTVVTGVLMSVRYHATEFVRARTPVIANYFSIRVIGEKLQIDFAR